MKMNILKSIHTLFSSFVNWLYGLRGLFLLHRRVPLMMIHKNSYPKNNGTNKRNHHKKAREYYGSPLKLSRDDWLRNIKGI